MTPNKLAVGLWVFGIVPDRFLPAGYQPDLELPEKLRRIGEIPGVAGVEIPFGPILTNDNIDHVNKLVNDNGLSVSSVTVNVTGHKKWARGSVTSPDPTVRRQAIDLIKDAMQAGKSLNVETLNLWMGQEGFDYPFEADYREIWDLMIDAFTEIASSCPEVRLALEYKPMEPRMRSLPNSAAQSLLMALDTRLPNVGVTIDYGHAVIGRENASQSAAMLSAKDKLYHIHFNDNYADWDWDMAAGVNHWWQLVEFCFWLSRLDYDGWYVADIFPYRQSPEELTDLSIRAFRKAWEVMEATDPAVIEEGFRQRSAMEIYRRFFD